LAVTPQPEIFHPRFQSVDRINRGDGMSRMLTFNWIEVDAPQSAQPANHRPIRHKNTVAR
jgi:hypothetical protein